jgi:hypothetical protein
MITAITFIAEFAAAYVLLIIAALTLTTPLASEKENLHVACST